MTNGETVFSRAGNPEFTLRGAATAIALVLVAGAIATPAAAATLEGAVAADAASGQQPLNDSVPQSTDDQGKIGDIIVTARKREESLQDVPISVTALTGDSLELRSITSTLQLGQISPSLNVGTGTGFVVYFLRGVGNAVTIPGVENSVASYVDGVYVARPTSAMQALQNIERIEVLRGPQGTLFGRNASGGLINIITRQPSEEFSIKANLSYGNYNILEGGAYISGPLASNLYAGISFSGRTQGKGFGVNLNTGTEIYKNNYYNIRGQLRFESGGFDATLAGWYSFIDNTMPGAQSIAKGAIPATANGGTYLGQPVGPARYTTRPRYNYTNYDPIYQLREQGISLTMNQDLGFANLTSITSYNKSSAIHATDFDVTDAFGWSSANSPIGGPIASPVTTFASTYKFPYFYSQELRLTSNGDGPLKWTLGGFFQSDQAGYDPVAVLGTTLVQPDLSWVGSYTKPGISRNIVGIVKTKALAAFLQATYTIAPGLDLTGGIRYNHEKKEFAGSVLNVTPGPVSNGIPQNGTATALFTDPGSSKTWNRPTWLISASYKFADTMVYASHNRGFRSGVYNVSAPSPAGAKPIEEEIVDAYEIGFKSDFLDNRLRLNGSAFLYDYTNLQYLIISPTSLTGTASLANAGDARIKGVELEVQARPTQSLTIYGNISYLDAKYTKFIPSRFLQPIVNAQGLPTGGVRLSANPIDLTGVRLAQTPEWTINTGVNFNHPISDNTNIVFNGDVSYKTSYGVNPEVSVVQKAFAVVNASLGIERKEESSSYKISLFVRNLTNYDYLMSGGAIANGLRTTYAEPRTFGLRISFER